MMTRFHDELNRHQSCLEIIDLTADVVKALAKVPRAEVPDMPDRIIAASALHLGLPVISRDGAIQLSDIGTIW
jgi:predicted nucleic acid-binding protein